MNGARPMRETGDRDGRRVTMLVRGDETGGQLAAVELHQAPGQEPPSHIHTNEDEIVYVLEGHLTFWIGDDEHRVVAGACVFLPRGIEHGYAVESEAARLLVVVAPAGSEGCFGEVEATSSPAGIERLIAVAARYGITLTGPAPAALGWAPVATSFLAGAITRDAREAGGATTVPSGSEVGQPPV